MTNREWLLNKMQSMSDEDISEVFMGCNYFCRVQGYKPCENGKYECKACRINWLKAEHKEKITLSEAERVILENIDKDYKWIARDKAENMLFIYHRKPYKNDYGNWLNGGTNHGLELFNHLFKFITWQDDEPYNIEELLNK